MMKRFLAIAGLFCASVAFGQSITPVLQPHVTYVDTSGLPCSGCLVYSYLAGTTTPTPTYTDSTGLSQNPNPVVLDAAGGAQVWVGKVTYKFVLKSALGATIWTVDNVPGAGGSALTILAIGNSVYLADGATPASVKAFGAKCDGSTDDTTAIQAGITWIAANHGNLTFPAGTCNISSSLTIPFAQQFRISGQAKLGSIINMTAANTPIFVANQANTHSVEIDHLELQFSSHQGIGATQAYGIQWTNAASDASGFYRWNVHDVQIDGAYIGMGIYTTAGNTETVWGSLFNHVIITNSSQNAISLVPTVPIGMPTNLFINLSIFNTGGGAPVPAGPAIFLSAVEATFIGLDVEGWKNEVIWSTGGGFVDVTGCHVEHETLSTSGRFFFMANGPISLQSCNFSIDGTPALTSAQVIGEGSGATITLKNDTMFVAPAGGSTFYWTTGNVANSLNFSGLNDSLSGMTSTVGVVPLAAIASWPDVYPILRQNQSTPQLVQIGSATAGVAGFARFIGADSSTPGIVFDRWTGAGFNWHEMWFYPDGSAVWHLQKCADVLGTASGPPVTAPTGCTDEGTLDGSGNLSIAGAYKIGAATVIPSGATGSTGTGNMVLSGTPTLVTPALGVATGTTLVMPGGSTPVISSSATSASLCLKVATVVGTSPPLIGVCTTVVSAGGTCTCN